MKLGKLHILIFIYSYIGNCKTESESETIQFKQNMREQALLIQSLQNTVNTLQQTVKGLRVEIGENERKYISREELHQDVEDYRPSCKCSEERERGSEQARNGTIHTNTPQTQRVPIPNRDLGARSTIDQSISFFAHLTKIISVKPGDTLVFDQAKTNFGERYDRTTGIFSVPTTATYMFMWKMLTAGGDLRTELVVNGTPMSAIDNDVVDKGKVSATGFAVIEAKTGDSVYIRVGTFEYASYLSASEYDYSSFAGYILT